jgi:Uma2 family endonuclease
MSSAVLSPPIAQSPPQTIADVPGPKRWTCDEFHKVGGAELFEDPYVMLINGKILEQHGVPDPRPKLFSCDEFHKIGDTGIFEGQNIILINGELLVMPAPGPLHDIVLTLLDELIRLVFSTGYSVRCQMSLVLGQRIDPIPDLAVVLGSARDYLKKPSTAALVVEVSEASLSYDTGDKASLYASAGIADYWVVDLNNRRLIVFRDPKVDVTTLFGYSYATETVHLPGASVAPLAAANASVAVSDLLP